MVPLGRIISSLGFILVLFLAGAASAYTAQDYYQAGITLYNQGQYQKSADYLNVTVQMDPANWQAFQMLGEAYYQLGDKDKAREAMNQSLQLNPNNPGLQTFVNGLGAPAAPSSPVASAPSPQAPASKGINAALAHNQIFFRESSGIGYFPQSKLNGALQVTVNDFKSEFPEGYGELSSVNGIFSFGNEIGFSWDPYNALTLSVDNNGGGAVARAYVGTGGEEQEASIYPSALAIGLNYEKFIPDHDGRWFGKIGVAYFLAHLDVEQVADGSFLSQGMNAGTVGGSVEVGREFVLFWILGLDLSVKATYADASGFKGPSPDGTSTDALVTLQDGALGVVDDSEVGQNGVKYATVDYLEICPMVSMDIHF